MGSLKVDSSLADGAASRRKDTFATETETAVKGKTQGLVPSRALC